MQIDVQYIKTMIAEQEKRIRDFLEQTNRQLAFLQGSLEILKEIEKKLEETDDKSNS